MAGSMVKLTDMALLLTACYVALSSAAVLQQAHKKDVGNNAYQTQQHHQYQHQQHQQQQHQQHQVPAVQADDDRFYHPAEVTKPKLIEQYDQRYLDGHYEYRYLLSNGDTRYERAYWLPVGKSMVLARKGYYSYPLPNHKYMTVFYTADHNGYHQDSATYSKTQPLLPRSLEVPEYTPPEVVHTPAISSTLVVPTVAPITTTRRPTRPRVTRTTTTKQPVNVPVNHWPTINYPW